MRLGADGSMCITGPVQLQMPVVEACLRGNQGADRAEMLRFACRFVGFDGWLFLDAGDLTCAMHWDVPGTRLRP